MSAMDLRAKQYLAGDGRSVRTIRIVLITGEPLWREGIRSAFHGTQSLILLDAATITGAVELAKSRQADMVVIEAVSLRNAMEMARALATHSPEIPMVAMIGRQRRTK